MVTSHRAGGAARRLASRTSMDALAEAAGCARIEDVATLIVGALVDSFGASGAALYCEDGGAFVRVASTAPSTFAERIVDGARSTYESGLFPQVGPHAARRSSATPWSERLVCGGRVVGLLRARFEGAPAAQHELDAFVTLAGVVFARARDAHAAESLATRCAERACRAAHDLRQPLNGVGLYAQLVARVDGPRREAAVVPLLATVRRMARAIEDFRDASLLELIASR